MTVIISAIVCYMRATPHIMQQQYLCLRWKLQVRAGLKTATMPHLRTLPSTKKSKNFTPFFHLCSDNKYIISASFLKLIRPTCFCVQPEQRGRMCTVTRLRLDGRGIVVRFLANATDSSFLQKSRPALDPHPVSNPRGNNGSFIGDKVTEM